MKIRERAKGHWDRILTGIGFPVEAMGGKHCPCPGCGGTDRFRYVRDDHGGFFCSSLRGDGLGLVMHWLELDFKAACERIESVLGKDADFKPEPREKTYAEILSQTAVRSERSAYLASRGLEVPPSLQWHRAALYHQDGEKLGPYSAMLAPVTRGGEWLTYHVTYLEGGAKAPVTAPRKLLPHPGILNGSSIALYDPEETMGIAEGIETAIAAKMLFGIPVWSALNTSLMKSWQPPSIAKSIVIFGDNDANFAGQSAAYALANSLVGRRKVEVQFPPDVGDWNDVLLRQKP